MTSQAISCLARSGFAAAASSGSMGLPALASAAPVLLRRVEAALTSSGLAQATRRAISTSRAQHVSETGGTSSVLTEAPPSRGQPRSHAPTAEEHQAALTAALAAIDKGALSDAAQHLSSASPVGVLQIARAAADLGACDRAFERELSRASANALPHLPPSSAADLMHALASLECYSLDCKDALASAVLARLPSYNGDDLGKTLRAFGSLGYWDNALLEGVAQHLSSTATELTPGQLADVVYAYSKSGYCHPALLSIVDAAATSLTDSPAEDEGHALSRVLDAVSRVGCAAPEALEGPLGTAAAEADRLSPEALAEIATGAIRLGYEDDSVLVPLLNALAGKLAAGQGIEDVEPKTIVKLVKALAGLRYPHPRLLDVLTDEVVPARLSEYSDTGLLELTDALNTLAYSNADFLGILKSRGVAGI